MGTNDERVTEGGDEAAGESADQLPEAGGTTQSSVVESTEVFDASGDPTGRDMTAKDMFDSGHTDSPGYDRRQ